jgi:hypothetical protein
LVAGLSFGVSTALLTHFAWYADARMNGMIPALTIGAGLAHAAAGAITGKRLLDTTRTQTSMHAAMLGAGTSLLALGLFAPALAAYVSASDASQQTVLGYMVMTLLTWLFAFLGAGWALLLLSVGVAAVLHRLAST